ncbi:hypothetical protein BDR04DRAFT_1116985 [Suillus decipiens]|nr:hypothetical protein BDR04DRAFT_1116985 [Suillus decipiens]
MPALRPPPCCCSGQLQAPQRLPWSGKKIVEKMQGPITRGRGGKSQCAQSPSTTGGSDHTKIQIQWLSTPSHTQKVVDHLYDHPADCQILFYSDGKQSHTENDCPLGKDKISVCTVIAKYVFEDDTEYADHYASAPDNLRKKYHECHDKLHATSAGIMPDGEGNAENLHVGSSYSESLQSGSAQFSTHPLPPSSHPQPTGTHSYPPYDAHPPLHDSSNQYYVPPPQPNYSTGPERPQYHVLPPQAHYPPGLECPQYHVLQSQPNYPGPECPQYTQCPHFRSLRSKPASIASASSAPVSTSMMSPSNPSSGGKARQVMKQQLDIQSQVDKLNDKIESIQSEKIMWDQLRNERYMAKYNLAHQVNEHKFLKTKHTDNHAEAAILHQCALEMRDSEICLCKAETKMHDVLAHAHKEEAEMLHLKIEYTRLTGSGS